MITTASPLCAEPPDWHGGFLEMLPEIERHARIMLRGLDPEALEDALSEVTANCLCAYRRLHERGELHRAFPSVLARYAIAQYREGRRVGNSWASRDLYSPQAFGEGAVERHLLGTPAEQRTYWRDLLVDNRRTPVHIQAGFRIDFRQWITSLSVRTRQIAEALAVGCTTGEVAKRFGTSAARISQIRRELADSWYRYHAGKEVTDPLECGAGVSA